MQDKLLIITKVKKTIDYLEKVVINYPHTEVILKNEIINNFLNVFIQKNYLDKKIISFKKYEIIGNHFLEIIKMVNSWILSEKNK